MRRPLSTITSTRRVGVRRPGRIRLERLVLVLVAGCSVPAVASGASSSSSPNLIKNGTFAVSGLASALNIAPGATTVPGWTAGPNGAQVLGSVMQLPPNTKQTAKLFATGPSSMTQTIATVPGTTYLLSWYGAGEPGAGEAVMTVHVLWNGSTVATQNDLTTGYTFDKMNWQQKKVVVTATSTTSTLEFQDASPPTDSGYAPLVTDVTLAADANLYLPKAVNVTTTGSLLAVVRNATNTTLTVSGLTVKLYGKTPTASYAPPVTELLATAPVAQGQASLKLHLAASLKGKTIPAYAILTGPDYIPVTVQVTLHVH